METTTVALAVGVLAAFASIAAAVLSWRSAKEAQRTADGIDRRRHMVEALDAETESFRSAVEALFQATYELDPNHMNISYFRISTRGQMLRLNPLATETLDDAVVDVMEHIDTVPEYADQLSDTEVEEATEYGSEVWRALRNAVREIFADQAEKRRALLAGL